MELMFNNEVDALFTPMVATADRLTISQFTPYIYVQNLLTILGSKMAVKFELFGIFKAFKLSLWFCILLCLFILPLLLTLSSYFTKPKNTTTIITQFINRFIHHFLDCFCLLLCKCKYIITVIYIFKKGDGY